MPITNLTFVTADGSGECKSKFLYFGSGYIAEEFILFLRSRWTVNKLENRVDVYTGTEVRCFQVIDDSDEMATFINTSIAIKDYTDQKYVYRVSIINKSSKITKVSDMFSNKKVADELANVFNTHSDAYYATVDSILVIQSKEDLDTLEKFIIKNSGHMISNIFAFTNSTNSI